MVASQLNNKVNFPEWKRVEEEDKEQELEMFETELHSVPVYVAVGQARNKFLRHRILYFPLYLMQPDDTACQVGVIEIESNNAIDGTRYSPETLLSENAPLLYSFATETYVRKHRKTPESEMSGTGTGTGVVTVDNTEQRTRKSENPKIAEKEVGEGEGEREREDAESRTRKSENPKIAETTEERTERFIPHIRRELFTLVPNVKVPSRLKEETEKEAVQHRKMYHERDDDTWLQKFLRNRGYIIVQDTAGTTTGATGNEKGDCIFTVVRDAFLEIGQETTEAKLRAYFADKVTDEWFQAYRQRYDVFEKEVVEKRAMSAKLKHLYDDLKAKIQNTFDRAQQTLFREEALRLKSEYEDMKTSHSFAKENLKPVQFMKDVATLDDFRKHVRTCDFWGDAWTLHWMQYHLNLQFIVFSAEQYKDGNMDAVLECVPATLRNKHRERLMPDTEEVVPEFYLLLVRDGERYRRIEYKKRALLVFSELPFDLKRMMADKCNETEGGRLEKVRSLVSYRNRGGKMYATLRGGIGGGSGGGGGIEGLIVWNTEDEKPLNLLVEQQLNEMDDAKLMDLYDDSVQFSLSSTASTTALPGQGAEERCDLEKCLPFAELAKGKEWRRKLDDSYVKMPLFQLDGHAWNSVEHFMSALPYKDRFQEYYLQFTHESNSELSKNAERAVAGASKAGKWKGTRIRPVEVDASREDMTESDRARLHDALVAKYTQNEDLGTLLLATLNAKLVRHRRGLPPLVLNQLMKVRDQLRRNRSFGNTMQELMG